MFFFIVLTLVFTPVRAEDVQRHLVVTPRPGRLPTRKTLPPTSKPSSKPPLKPSRKPALKPSRKPALKPTRKPTPLDAGCPSNATDADKSIACEFIGIPDLKQCIKITKATYSFEGKDLFRTLPSQLGLLSNLRYLDIMTFNHTVLPTTIGCLTNLKALSISWSLIGEIPSALGSLTQLTSLNLFYNVLIGTIPSSFASLTNLKELNLDSNLLTGTFPSFFASLTNLKGLYLEGNFLKGTIPDALCDLGLKPMINCDEVECNCCYFRSFWGAITKCE
jgi:Leucine rich repeat